MSPAPPQRFPTGALPTPPEKLAQGWDIHLALAAAPTAAPPKFHHPGCTVTLNQSPYGACVGYGTTAAHAAQELADEGRMLIPTVLDPLHLYAASKGLRWPPPPDAPILPLSWDPTPGTWPTLVLAEAKANGIPTKDGSPPRKIGAYYLLGEPNATAGFLDVYQQTLLQLGPAIFSMLWTQNWFVTLAGGYMAAPNFSNAPSGHLVEACGYQTPCGTGLAGCTWDAICHQTWGDGWGRDPEFKAHFRIHSPHLGQVGKEAWKWTDVKGSGSVASLVIVDKIARLVDTTIGAQIYRVDGTTPLVKISSGNLGIASSAALSGNFYAVIVSVGGILQLGAIKAAACTNVRVIGTDPAAINSSFNEGVTAASTAALTAKKP